MHLETQGCRQQVRLAQSFAKCQVKMLWTSNSLVDRMSRSTGCSTEHTMSTASKNRNATQVSPGAPSPFAPSPRGVRAQSLCHRWCAHTQLKQGAHSELGSHRWNDPHAVKEEEEEDGGAHAAAFQHQPNKKRHLWGCPHCVVGMWQCGSHPLGSQSHCWSCRPRPDLLCHLHPGCPAPANATHTPGDRHAHLVQIQTHRADRRTHALTHAPIPGKSQMCVPLHGRAMRIRCDVSQVMLEVQDLVTTQCMQTSTVVGECHRR